MLFCRYYALGKRRVKFVAIEKPCVSVRVNSHIEKEIVKMRGRLGTALKHRGF